MLLCPVLTETKQLEPKIACALIVLDSFFGANKLLVASSSLSFLQTEEKFASMQTGFRPAMVLKRALCCKNTTHSFRKLITYYD